MSYWSIGAMIVSAAISATSAYVQSENAQEQADYQKKVAENNNLMIERQQIDNANIAAQEAADKRTQTLRMMARQSASGAANGLAIGSGSLEAIQTETSQTGALDMFRIINNAQRGNQALKTEQMNNTAGAQLSQMQADSIGQQSMLSMAGSGVKLAGGLASGYQWKDSSGNWQKPKYIGGKG